MSNAKPAARPHVPYFSSGPCPKHPGWTLASLGEAALGRSHRAKLGKAKLKQAIELTRAVLELPAGYRVGIVPRPTPVRSRWRCGRCWARAR